MAKQRESLEVAFQQLKELMSGATMRSVAGIKDAGEVFTATIGDDTDTVHDVHAQKHDVWTRVTDVLSGLSTVARLYAPAGILWRFTPKGAGAHVVRGRKMRAPGAALAIPDGGDGSSQVVPGWDDGTNLDKDNAGILLPEGFHVESQNDRVRIVANSGGTKAVIELQKGGKITINSASGQNIEIVSSGGNVVVNGGALSVARVTDTVTGQAGPYPIVSGQVSGPGAANFKA